MLVVCFWTGVYARCHFGWRLIYKASRTHTYHSLSRRVQHLHLNSLVKTFDMWMWLNTNAGILVWSPMAGHCLVYLMSLWVKWKAQARPNNLIPNWPSLTFNPWCKCATRALKTAWSSGCASASQKSRYSHELQLLHSHITSITLSRPHVQCFSYDKSLVVLRRVPPEELSWKLLTRRPRTRRPRKTDMETIALKLDAWCGDTPRADHSDSCFWGWSWVVEYRPKKQT